MRLINHVPSLLWSMTIALAPMIALGAPHSINQWIPNDAQHGVVIQNIALDQHSRAVIDQFQKLAQGAPGAESPFKVIYEHLSKIDWERQDFEGFSLKRGLGFFLTDDLRMRVAVGVNQLDRLLKAAQVHLKGNAQISLSADRVKLGEVTLRCGQTEGWWVCDSAPFPQPKDAPLARSLYQDSLLWIHGTAGTLTQNHRGFSKIFKVFQSLDLQFTHDELTTLLQLRGTLPPTPFNLLLDAPRSTHSILHRVSELSPVTFRVNLPMAALVAQFGPMLDAQAPPPMKPIWRAIREGFTGELTFSFSHSLLNPSVMLGVKSKKLGEAILKQIEIFPNIELIDTEDARALVFSIPNSPMMKLKMGALVTDDAIVLALDQSDLSAQKMRGAQSSKDALTPPPAFKSSLLGVNISMYPQQMLNLYRVILQWVEVPMLPPEMVRVTLDAVTRALSSLYDVNFMLDATSKEVVFKMMTRNLPLDGQ
jgi:hypothetical protein